jgi:hypothetical protein
MVVLFVGVGVGVVVLIAVPYFSYHDVATDFFEFKPVSSF